MYIPDDEPVEHPPELDEDDDAILDAIWDTVNEEEQMPYTIVTQDEQFFVHKVGEDGNATGESLGSHDTRNDAIAQIAAIESQESGKSSNLLTYQGDAVKKIDSDDVVKLYRDFYTWLEVADPKLSRGGFRGVIAVEKPLFFRMAVTYSRSLFLRCIYTILSCFCFGS